MDSTLLIVIIAAVCAVVALAAVIAIARFRKKREAERRRVERDGRRAERMEARRREKERQEQEAQEALAAAQEAESARLAAAADELMDEPVSFDDGTRFEFVSDTVYTTIHAIEPCGFDFTNVVAGFRGLGKEARGDADGQPVAPSGNKEPQTVYAQGSNFEKVKADIEPMMPLFVALSEPRAAIVYKAVFPDLPRMLGQIRPFGMKEGAIKGIENVPVITVADDESAKRIGAFPVKVRVVMLNRDVLLEKRSNSAIAAAHAAANVPALGYDEAAEHAHAAQTRMPDSLVLDMFYEPGGRAAKGRVVAWENKNGYLCEFSLGRVSGDYIPTALRVTSAPGTWRTIFE